MFFVADVVWGCCESFAICTLTGAWNFFVKTREVHKQTTTLWRHTLAKFSKKLWVSTIRNDVLVMTNFRGFFRFSSKEKRKVGSGVPSSAFASWSHLAFVSDDSWLCKLYIFHAQRMSELIRSKYGLERGSSCNGTGNGSSAASCGKTEKQCKYQVKPLVFLSFYYYNLVKSPPRFRCPWPANIRMNGTTTRNTLTPLVDKKLKYPKRPPPATQCLDNNLKSCNLVQKAWMVLLAAGVVVVVLMRLISSECIVDITRRSYMISTLIIYYCW